jgi:hypothetical protein
MIFSVFLSIAFIIIVMQAYSNSKNASAAREQGIREVLDYLCQNYSFDMENLVSVIDFDKKITDGKIFVSGPYNTDNVKIAAKKYKMYYVVLTKTIYRIFEKYSYEPQQTILNSNFKDEIYEYCSTILRKKDA